MKVKHYLGGWKSQTWEGSLGDAMQIALTEIREHAGNASAAYAFTKAIFDELKGMIFDAEKEDEEKKEEGNGKKERD